MSNQFLTFKSFLDNETAKDFAEVLKQKKISYFIEEDTLVFDPSYAFNPLNKEYLIKIRQRDFKEATLSYEEYFQKNLDKVDRDYYLFEFSDEELKEIIAKPDEWGSFDYQLAQKLLKQRGIEVTEIEKNELKAKRYKELAKPDKERTANIILTYIICFFFFPIGIILGWVWGYSKKTLPDGRRVHVYSESVQNHGRIIFLMGMVIFVFTVLWRITGILK